MLGKKERYPLAGPKSGSLASFFLFKTLNFQRLGKLGSLIVIMSFATHKTLNLQDLANGKMTS